MCIRDSPRVDLEKITGIEIPPSHRDKDKRLKQKEHLELARFSRDIRQRMNAVSYTHLDVYKRQA